MICKHIAIVGAAGIPANYGGFETLAENIVRYHDSHCLTGEITVYCSSQNYPVRATKFLSATLVYIPLSANGAQSIFYDVIALFLAILKRADVILLLGVSGAIALPLVRFFSSAKIITNIDGIEWRRQKWHGLAKSFLRFSEKLAVRFSHVVISDNAAIASYVKQVYGITSEVIAYGGDHAVAVKAEFPIDIHLPRDYAFSVCRIEPENNVHIILEAFSVLPRKNLVIVGNWNNSDYGLDLYKKYIGFKNILCMDPIYNLGILKTLRLKSSSYIHGHSAGGTNPSLVEAMHFSKPIYAFDCVFNRSTTENKAIFFESSETLTQLLRKSTTEDISQVAESMLEIGKRKYIWKIVAHKYFQLFDSKI
jgi:glycosyltransferase involved in cell wall biosynthesis